MNYFQHVQLVTAQELHDGGYTKTRNGMETERTIPLRFFFPRFFALKPYCIYLPLNPKNFDLGIPNPKSKLFVNNRKITKCSVLPISVPGF